MGKMICIDCSCGYKDNLIDGLGMMAMKFPEQIFKDIKEGLYEPSGISRDDVESVEEICTWNTECSSPALKRHGLGYRILQCRKCNGLSDSLHFSFINKDGTVRFPKERCGKCGILLRRVNPEKVKSISCPSCGKELSFEDDGLMLGFWD